MPCAECPLAAAGSGIALGSINDREYYMFAIKRHRDDRPHHWRPIALVAIVLVAALTGAGCKATGGGSIPTGVNGKKPATFGLVWQETKQSEKFVVRGSWADSYIKFKITDGFIITFTGECGGGLGTYVSTNRNDPGTGTLAMSVCDYGEPGPSSGDTISVTTLTGPFNYTNSGDLEHGNLQLS